MWLDYKTIYQTTTNVIVKKNFEQIPLLEDLLVKNRELFLKILQNSPKSTIDRDALRKASKDGIQLDGYKQKHVLSQAFIEETIILSDLYNLNEYLAVELLLEAETQMEYFPGLTRGLTAILLYYDSKKSLVNTLKTLLLVRSGRTWILDESIPSEFTKFISDYCNKLVYDGLVPNLIKQCEAYNWQIEQENLLREGGIGNAKHRKQVKNEFDEIKIGLAECLFNCACQAPLKQKDTLTVLNYLKKIELNPQTNKLDLENVYLLMSLLYCFDSSFLENKSKNDLVQALTLWTNSDASYLNDLYVELDKVDYDQWKIPGLKGILQFAFGVYLSVIQPYLNETELLTNAYANVFDDDENLIEKSLEQRVFKYLSASVVANDKFHREKYFVEQMHNLFVNFIYKMPTKIRELKTKNEEIAKLLAIEESMRDGGSIAHAYYSQFNSTGYGFQSVAHQRRDFEDFLNLIGDFYSKDPLKLELNLNYWLADSELGIQANMNSFSSKPSNKQIALFKFVRYFLSGDSLTGTLYMAYIHMLTGLCTGEESAQHCFILLQHNGNFYDSQNPNISWNHIFYAFERYYDSLRAGALKVPQSVGPTGLRSLKGIAQQELQALILVTRLVNQIAFYSEKSRIALCEFQRGSDLTIAGAHQPNNLPILMFGLLGCPIPVNLKGELLNLLASLSLTPQIASNMWQALENSQIINTISLQPSKSGIEIELEEIEAKEETYPLLIGFLELIKNLTKVKIPDNLGIGYRSKGKILGFQPYLHFLVTQVYLKFFTRGYKNQSEKWKIGSLLLDIIYRLIVEYEPNYNDFKNELDGSDQCAKSPGYCLIYEFIHDGPIFRMLFTILGEALKYYYEFNLENEPNIDSTSLIGLKIINTVLGKQKALIEFMKNSNMNVVNTGIEKLMVIINSKTNKIDYLMTLFRFIQFSNELITHTYYSLNALIQLCDYTNLSSQLLNFFLISCGSPKEQSDIQHGFVECIQFEEADSSHDDDTLEDISNFNALCRLKALKFIQINLSVNIPSIAHLLLGIDVRRPLNKAQFFLPGTNLKDKSDASFTQGSIVPRNCLHSIIDILNNLIKDPSIIQSMHLTIDLSYEILYNLTSNYAFTNQLLDYLRNEYDFVYNHLERVPFVPPIQTSVSIDKNATILSNDVTNQTISDTLPKSDDLSRSIYSANSWILYLACLEMQNLLTNRMRSQLQKLVSLLTEKTDTVTSQQDETAHESLAFFNTLANQSKSNTFLFNLTQKNDTIFSMDDQQSKATSKKPQIMSKLQKILASIELTDERPSFLNLNFFDVKLTEKVINSCLYKADFATQSVQLYDLKQIKAILMNEISSDSSLVTSKVNLIGEIKSILNNVAERNQFQLKFIAKKTYLDSLKRLVESLIILSPDEIFDLSSRYNFLITFIKNLFDKVFEDDPIIELTYSFADLLFTLVFNLKKVLEESHKKQIILSNVDSTVLVQQGLNFFNPKDLFDILSKTIEYLLNSSLRTFKVRTYLYGILINYLEIFKFYETNDDVDQNGSKMKNLSGYESFNLSTITHMSTKLDARDNFLILSQNAEHLLKIVAADACEGMNITTMMGLSLLNSLLELDRQNLWLKFLNDNGYLSVIVNSFQNDNQYLEECFSSDQANRKAVFVYETKMSILTSIAKNPQGAEYLLNNNIISILSMLNVFTLRTKFDRNVYGANSSPQLIELLHLFYQIYFPVLTLCSTIITSMGSEKIEVKSQVARFILCHSETFLHILTSKIGDIKMLEEIKLVTLLLSKLAPFEELNFDSLPSNLSVEYNANLTRIQKDLINLIATYFVPEQLKLLRREIESRLNADDRQSRNTCRLYLTQIASNLSSFCSSMMKGSSLRMSLLIFSPKFIDNMMATSTPGNIMSNRMTTRHLQFMILVDYLRYTLDNLERSIEFENDLLSKKERLNDLMEIEIKQIIVDYKQFQMLLPHDKQFYLKDQLNSLIKLANSEIKVYILVIEKCLLILWRHIEFYLSYNESSSKTSKANSFFLNIQDTPTKTEQTLQIEGISKNDLTKFKHDLPLCLPSSLMKKIVDIDEKYIKTKTNSMFIGFLVKRIQRLIHLHSQ